MDRNTELKLIEEGISLCRDDRRYLDEYSIERNSDLTFAGNATDRNRAIFNALPHSVAHSS